MMESHWRPDVVVGVDFGMTSTGVAYSAAPEWERPETIGHWPGAPRHSFANKVDTVLAYDKRSKLLMSWGFFVDSSNLDFRTEESFKLFLDPEYRGNFPNAPSLENARQCYVDYLAYIYEFINSYFNGVLPRWNTRHVEFVFSVPAIWKDPRMIERLKLLIRAAGFGQNPKHRFNISLTDAEAAGASVAKGFYKKGDVFLLCDIGGGSTDVIILKVSSTEIGHTELEPLSYVEGVAIGSSLIDFHIEKMLKERLKTMCPDLITEPEVVAHQMMKGGRFESFKCSYGLHQQTSLDLLLQIPNGTFGTDIPKTETANSTIVITQRYLQNAFDRQIDDICGLIDSELKKLQITNPNESVNYLVLSGGLGSSAYLRQTLTARYERDGGEHANAEGIEVKMAQNPQLAVVHGLVIDRVQNLKNQDTLVFPKRRCRASYGIVVRQVYNRAKHIGEDISIDPRDGQVWAERQIQWFVKQGEVITVKDGFQQPIRRKFSAEQVRTPRVTLETPAITRGLYNARSHSISSRVDSLASFDSSQFVPPPYALVDTNPPTRTLERTPQWATQVVMSFLPANQLPRSLKRDGARPVCAVESVVIPRDLKLKNRHWYNTRSQYYRAEFDLRVRILAASLEFEIVGKDGTTISTNSDEVLVNWQMADSDSNTVTPISSREES